MNVPSWLTRTKGAEAMDEDYMEIPPVATIPPPSNGSVGVGQITDLHAVPPREIMRHAANLAEQYDKDKETWHRLATDAGTKIKDLQHELEFTKLELIKSQNDLQNLQARFYELQHNNAEFSTFFQSIRAQMDHFEVPLPIRKRRKNGDKAKEQYVAKDDPRLDTIIGSESLKIPKESDQLVDKITGI